MRILVAEGVIWRDLGEEVVILNLATSTYFGLSGAGGHMWRQLADHGSPDQAVDALYDEFEVEAQVLRADLDALIRDLESRSLVVLEATASERASAPARIAAPVATRLKAGRKIKAPRRVKAAKKKGASSAKPGSAAAKKKSAARGSKMKARKRR